MNERDLRTKKQSLVLTKNLNDKTFYNHSHVKAGPTCEPKQPPNISRHYLETRKKDTLSREFIRPDIAIYCHEVQKVRSKIMMQTRHPRPSQSKYQEETRIKKTKREPHYISKPHKAKHPKNCSKENRQSRSNMDFEQQRHQKEKIARTQTLDQACMLYPEALTCKQKIIKKIKKNIKPLVFELHQESHSRTTMEHVTPKKSFAQEMAEFQAISQKIQIQSESSTLTELFFKEQLYSKVQNYNCYLTRTQHEITWSKRAKVMNWMIEILAEMGSRREVFGLATNFIDRYLACTANLPQEKLQILACAAMSIANKIEGMTFSINSLRIPGISFAEILELEEEVCRVLKWKLNPPTLNMWANRISQHWDIYLEHHLNSLPQLLSHHLEGIKFKDTQSYMNFRTLMQYVDLVILDIQTLQYHNRELAASFIYLMLAQKLGLESRKDIYSKYPTSSQYLIKENDLNDFYCEFLQQSFGFSLQDLLPTIQYCSTYIMLPLTFELPEGVQECEDKEVPFSQFCALMTYNVSNLAYINSRNREID